MIREQLFGASARYSMRHPWVVLGSALVAALVSIHAAMQHLEIKTSNLDLVNPELPAIRDFLAYADEFGTPNVLVMVLEGADEGRMQVAVDELEAAVRALPGVRNVVGHLPFDADRLATAGIDRYLVSRDRGMYMLFIQPEDSRSRADTMTPLLAGVRRVIEAGGYEGRGIRVGLTGIPQYAVDDRDIIQQDISTLSTISFVLVAILFAWAFTSVRRPLMAMVALGFAVVVMLGIMVIHPGHLTLLSAFFASILFGLGIDYGIHIINRAEELMQEGQTEPEAIARSIAALSPDLSTGAITTAVVFFAMMASGFRGFAELGLIAGAGVLICLLMMCTVLPALLSIVPFRGRRTASAGAARIGRMVIASQHPAISLVIVIAVAAALLLGRPPPFDGNYAALQPADSEAVRLEQAMVERSDLSPQFAVFTTDDKNRAVDLADRLVDEPSVAAVRSVSDLEMLGDLSEWPDAFARQFVSTSGHYAVYAYPGGNVWNPPEQDAFVAAMKRHDPSVTGMPVLGQFMTALSAQALFRTSMLGGLLMIACVYLDFRRLVPTALAVMPTLLTVACMQGIMNLLRMPFNPINIMALPVILGIAVDDGVHIVHRFIHENGDMERTLAGSGRSIVMTSLTTIAAFVSLAFTRHRGLASFSILLVIGVGVALLLSVVLLPPILKRTRRHVCRADAGVS